jgi:2-oxo-4-hydroxy-4-carboxy--5-ureidoimidazoline (OHCU) decarboxylase
VAGSINAHPRLGDKTAMDAKRDASKSGIQKQTASEQDALLREQGEVVAEVTKWSKRYEQKFGHVFLLFAHGKRMADVLASIQARSATSAQGRACLHRSCGCNGSTRASVQVRKHTSRRASMCSTARVSNY